MRNDDGISGLGESTSGNIVPQEREYLRRKDSECCWSWVGKGEDAKCHSDLLSLGAYGSISKDVPDLSSCLRIMRQTA